MPKDSKDSLLNLDTLRGNLARAGSRAFASYQQTMDKSLFFMSGSMLANEKDFNELRSNFRFAPSEKHAMSFERAKFEAQRLALKNSLQEGLAALAILLEDVRVICSMAAHVGEKDDEVKAAVKEITGKPRAAFFKLPLPARLDQLKEQFEIPVAQKESIESFLRLVNCLQAHGGVVGKADVDSSGALNIPLMSFGIGADDDPAPGEREKSAEKKLQLRVLPKVKTIAAGQPIDFNHAEHIATILTLCVVTGALVQGADRFLESSGASKQESATPAG